MFRILFLFTLVTSMSGRRLLQTEMGGGGGAAGGGGAMGGGVPGSQSDSIGNSDNTVGLRMLFGHNGATNEGDHAGDPAGGASGASPAANSPASGVLILFGASGSSSSPSYFLVVGIGLVCSNIFKYPLKRHQASSTVVSAVVTIMT